jgi:hypothetical protein
MCSPATFGPEFVVDAVAEAEVVNVAMAARYDHTESPEIKIQLRDNPEDTPSGVQNSATARDVIKTMVWTGYVTTHAVPTHLLGAPDRCLVYLRIIKDLEDNNKVLDDILAMLYTPEHLARKFCEEPRKLEIAMFFCDHPQRVAIDLTDVTTPHAGVQMSRAIKAQRDFGIRRWLTDAGCGRDLVQTSLALKGGGKVYVRLRAPKHLNIANGSTSITKEMTMCMPPLDEMAEMLCCQNTPAVISVGERCFEMGCAFFWPPFSQRPLFTPVFYQT